MTWLCSVLLCQWVTVQRRNEGIQQSPCLPRWKLQIPGALHSKRWESLAFSCIVLVCKFALEWSQECFSSKLTIHQAEMDNKKWLLCERQARFSNCQHLKWGRPIMQWNISAPLCLHSRLYLPVSHCSFIKQVFVGVDVRLGLNQFNCFVWKNSMLMQRKHEFLTETRFFNDPDIAMMILMHLLARFL